MSEKKLCCVVVTDPAGILGSLESPIVFHVKSDTQAAAEEKAKSELASEDYGYEPEDIEYLDIFTFEVTELDVIEG